MRSCSRLLRCQERVRENGAAAESRRGRGADLHREEEEEDALVVAEGVYPMLCQRVQVTVHVDVNARYRADDNDCFLCRYASTRLHVKDHACLLIVSLMRSTARAKTKIPRGWRGKVTL